MKGQLPKAYLRLDPNIYLTHPDPGAFVRLLCIACSQPRRGRFKSWELFVAALGKSAALKHRDRWKDIEPEGEGWVVSGWDDWQEGDFTVGERMKRIRSKKSTPTQSTTSPSDSRNTAVTEPYLNRNPPSEASGVKERTNGLTDLRPSGAVPVPPPKPRKPPTPGWNVEACDDWTARFQGTAPKERISARLKPLVDRHTWAVLRPAWRRYLAENEPKWTTPEDFSAKPGPWLSGTNGNGAGTGTARGRPTAAEVTGNAVRKILAEEAEKARQEPLKLGGGEG